MGTETRVPAQTENPDLRLELASIQKFPFVRKSQASVVETEISQRRLSVLLQHYHTERRHTQGIQPADSVGYAIFCHCLTTISHSILRSPYETINQRETVTMFHSGKDYSVQGLADLCTGLLIRLHRR